MAETDVLSRDSDPLSASYAPDPSEKLELEKQEQGQKQRQEMLQKAVEQTKKTQEAAERQTQIEKAGAAAMEAPTQSAIESSKGVSAATKNRPQLEQVPKAPQKAQPDESWLFLAGLIGTTAGLLTRNHASNALAAFTGTINGLSERDEAKFQSSMKTWEAENKRVIETNKQRLDDYQQTIDNAKLDFDQKVNELKLKSKLWQDKAMAAAADTKNQQLIGNLMDTQLKIQDSYSLNSQKLIDQKNRYNTNNALYKIKVNREEAEKEVARTPQITEAMLNGSIQGPPRSPRGDSMSAWVDRIRLDQLTQRGYKGDQYDVMRAGHISEARVLAAASANIRIVLDSAEPALQNAAEAAAHVPTTAFPSLNKLIQKGAELVGDPALKAFQISSLEVTEALARAMNPRSSIIAVSNMERAAAYVSTADSPEAYTAMLKNVARFINRENQVIQDIKAGKPPHEIVIEDIPRSLRPINRELLPKTQGLTQEGAETTRYYGDRGNLMGHAKDWLLQWLTEPPKPATLDTTRTLPLTTAPPGGA